jgi:hypothetical protein
MNMPYFVSAFPDNILPKKIPQRIKKFKFIKFTGEAEESINGRLQQWVQQFRFK